MPRNGAPCHVIMVRLTHLVSCVLLRIILNILHVFEQSLNDIFCKKDPEKVRLDDRTYVIRQHDGKHLVAFNGSKYLIVCPSKTMYIIVETEGRKDKVEELVVFVKGLCSKLSAKNY